MKKKSLMKILVVFLAGLTAGAVGSGFVKPDPGMDNHIGFDFIEFEKVEADILFDRLVKRVAYLENQNNKSDKLFERATFNLIRAEVRLETFVEAASNRIDVLDRQAYDLEDYLWGDDQR